jgi:hypothetical protein
MCSQANNLLNAAFGNLRFDQASSYVHTWPTGMNARLRRAWRIRRVPLRTGERHWAIGRAQKDIQ